MSTRRAVLLAGVAVMLLASADTVLADPTTDTPAVKVTPGAQTPDKEDTPKHKDIKLKLAEGEKLTYAVKWGAVDAGMATLSVKRKEQLGPGGPLVWNVQCKTRSNAFMSIFYEVRDDIKTLVDTEGGFTRLFDMEQNEGNYHATERIEFDYAAMEAKYVKTTQKLLEQKTRTKVISLRDKVQDPLSCLYYIRGLDMAVGSEHKMTVNTNKKNWTMSLKVLREEEQEFSGLGKVTCLVVEPVAEFQGIFVRKGKATVWLEKQTKVPMMMRVSIPIGSASAVLVKAENSPLSKLVADKAPAKK
jgi:hypothetical protein